LRLVSSTDQPIQQELPGSRLPAAHLGSG